MEDRESVNGRRYDGEESDGRRMKKFGEGALLGGGLYFCGIFFWI
jgi:hypothetical protein